MIVVTNDIPGLSLSAFPVQREGLECHFIEGEAILYDFAHHALHYLNTTAYEIWRNCDGNTSAEQLLAKVAATFEKRDGHDPAAVEADLSDALQNLIENGLVDCSRK